MNSQSPSWTRSNVRSAHVPGARLPKSRSVSGPSTAAGLRVDITSASSSEMPSEIALPMQSTCEKLVPANLLVSVTSELMVSA